MENTLTRACCLTGRGLTLNYYDAGRPPAPAARRRSCQRLVTPGRAGSELKLISICELMIPLQLEIRNADHAETQAPRARDSNIRISTSSRT